MVLTVLENAYLRKAEEINTYNESHKQIILFLLNNKQYFTKDELLCFTNHCETKLDKTLKELEKATLIKIEGWLVKLEERQKLEETLIRETLTQPKFKNKLK
jgi:hypothetical protein